MDNKMIIDMESLDQKKKEKKKQITRYTLVGGIIAVAVIAIAIIISVINTNKAVSQIETYRENEQFEHAFDYIIAENIGAKTKNKYLDEIIEGMRKQFNKAKSDTEVLDVDGMMICKTNNELFYFDENAKLVTLYKSYDAEMDYRTERGVIVCYEGDRIWLKDDFMYSNGWIYFYEVRDIWKAGNLDNTITLIKRVNIENGKSETIDHNDINLSGLYKLSDGRILLDDYNDMIYDPYKNKLTKNEGISEFDKESCIYTTDD